jgi:DNA-binding Lrp family transcriptional regulator
VTVELDLRDRRLLTAAQAAFPLELNPYAALGMAASMDEQAAIDRLAALKASRIIRRIGPVFEPSALGVATELVAVEVDPDRLEATGAEIAEWPQVTHCYQRDHVVNLWFAGAAASGEWFERAKLEVLSREGVKGVWRLPTRRRFKIGVVFDLVSDGAAEVAVASKSTRPGRVAAEPGSVDLKLLRALETDLPVSARPFAGAAGDLGMSEEDLLGIIRGWLAAGRMRRYGAQLNHRRLGFTANAMTVWEAPANAIERAGETMAAEPAVTHCYERPGFEGFPYNLYAMIHGRSPESCAAVAERLARACGLEAPLLLYSSREFKKSTPPLSLILAAS